MDTSPPSRPRSLRGLSWALALIGGPLFILGLLLGTPLLGNVVGLYLVSSVAECSMNAGSFEHCWLWGEDIADIASGYAIGIFIGGLINPILFLRLLSTFLPSLVVLVWCAGSIALAVAWFVRWRGLRRARTV
jgi:hypothetical protein